MENDSAMLGSEMIEEVDGLFPAASSNSPEEELDEAIDMSMREIIDSNERKRMKCNEASHESCRSFEESPFHAHEMIVKEERSSPKRFHSFKGKVENDSFRSFKGKVENDSVMSGSEMIEAIGELLPAASNNSQEEELDEAIDMSMREINNSSERKGCSESDEASRESCRSSEESSHAYEMLVKEERSSPERFHSFKVKMENDSVMPGSEMVEAVDGLLPIVANNSQEEELDEALDMSMREISDSSQMKECSESDEESLESCRSFEESPFHEHEMFVKDERSSPEPVDLSLHERSPQYQVLEETMVVHQEEGCESLDLSMRNGCLSVQEILRLSLRERQDGTDSQSDMTFRERCDSWRNLLSVTVEIKEEKEEDTDDLFCVDGITDVKQFEEKVNFGNVWKPKEFFDQDQDNDDDSKLFKCSTCSKQFLTKTRLNKHLLTHSEECFRCSFCDFNTKRKDYLRVHEMNHLETKMFKCLKCSFGTNVRSRLKVHASIHAEEKSFKCFKCSYKTTRKDNLKLHELNHLDIKRFKCDHCDYGSNNKRNLKEHMLNHLDWRMFKCEDCPYETNKKGNLQLHMTKHVRKLTLK